MKRALPIINIQGTDFKIDIDKLRLTEKANENNFIPLGYMSEVPEGGYEFDYGLKSRNIRNIWIDEKSVRVKIPELVELDPLGMSERYNIPLQELKDKTDFEIMVNQKLFDQRVNQGILPTINIAGYLFYVVIDKDRLIPKNDPASEGIPLPFFAQYDQVLGDNVFAYDPKNREIKEIDYFKITEIPEGLIAIQLPYSFSMDPIGWNLIVNKNAKSGLKTCELKMHFTAPQIPWEKTDLPDIIKENLEEEKKKQMEQKQKTPIQHKSGKKHRM